VAGALVWLKPWAPSVTLAPSRLVRLVTESAQVQVPAPVPPPATPETTAGRPPAVKQTAAPRRNPRPAPPRAAVSNSSAVAIVPRHDTTPAVTPPVTPPVAQNPGPAPIPAAPAPPPPPPPPAPRPQLESAIPTYARPRDALATNATTRVAPGPSAHAVHNRRAFFEVVRSLTV